MEEVFERFPYLLCRQIFSELDNEYLTKCREVSRDWRLAVDSQRILMMQRYTKCSRKLLKKILRKEDLVDLATQTRKLYEKYPITSSKNRMMPLHEAAKIGNLPILELIVENHEDINCRDGYGWTPLHWAAESGHLEICQLIFPCIKEKNPEDKYGKTAFDVAFQNQHWKVCELIIENNQDDIINFVKKSQLFEDFQHERFDIDNLRSLANNAFSESGKLPLFEKIMEGIHYIHWGFSPSLNLKIAKLFSSHPQTTVAHFYDFIKHLPPPLSHHIQRMLGR